MSRRRCNINERGKVSICSLVGYRNNLFTSDNPDRIVDFYDSFQNKDQLIDWMKERPKGATYIHEIEGVKDVIVVIPTADFNGQYARRCREDIFKRLHMIFVESAEIPDQYFNYAHNCNVGIRKALEYNPKWVVVSNDDMFKIDDSLTLLNQLKNIDSQTTDTVFVKGSVYHSKKTYLGKTTVLFPFFSRILYHEYMKRFVKLRSKFLIDRLVVEWRGIFSLSLLKELSFMNHVDFGIFSSNFLRQFPEGPFDETYINHLEDSDLSLRIALKKRNVAFIDYMIGDFVGSTLGVGIQRHLRGIASEAYFNYKLEKVLTNRSGGQNAMIER